MNMIHVCIHILSCTGTNRIHISIYMCIRIRPLLVQIICTNKLKAPIFCFFFYHEELRVFRLGVREYVEIGDRGRGLAQHADGSDDHLFWVGDRVSSQLRMSFKMPSLSLRHLPSCHALLYKS